jgi:hypothetical protein
MENVLTLLTGLFVGAVGTYFSGYSTEKGKNLATKEDIKQLTAQTALLTQTTEHIKAEISDKVWDRQRHWEMKRDSLFAAIQALDRADSALVHLATVLNWGSEPIESDDGSRAVEKTEAMVSWREAANGFDDKRAIASLVCSREMSSALSQASLAIRSGASKLFKDNSLQYSELALELATRTSTAHNLARKELGIET